MSAIAIIPARGGSRRIPRKNFRSFCGRPILAYSVETALVTNLFDHGVWVSAEEADWGEIGMAAPRAGWVRRYPEFARDEVGTQEVTRHALEVLIADQKRGGVMATPEFVCCIYATAPTMAPDDLKRGFAAMLAREDYAFIHGWFYWGRAEWFLQGRPLGRELTRPVGRWIDINDHSEWARAEQIYEEMHAAH